MPKRTEVAVLGGGCFWCTEAVFKQLKGVKSVMPGYAGGNTENPTYDQVALGNTGHAEVIKIEFDSEEISYRDLLDVFWETHDPTTPDRQGNDVGPQYRSIILYTSEEQKDLAETSKQKLDAPGKFKNPIITEIKPLLKFYPAEEYHRDYFAKNPDQAYCQIVISPKLEKLRQTFPKKVKG